MSVFSSYSIVLKKGEQIGMSGGVKVKESKEATSCKIVCGLKGQIVGLRPYHPERARSRLISEAKQGRAWLVLGWETAWEYRVL